MLIVIALSCRDLIKLVLPQSNVLTNFRRQVKNNKICLTFWRIPSRIRQFVNTNFKLVFLRFFQEQGRVIFTQVGHETSATLSVRLINCR
ncbi:MAG: hypothetical protein CMJ46_06380 [Planctomyces sp.]|nr:hypothetical protein [Planctomyces sp.]